MFFDLLFIRPLFSVKVNWVETCFTGKSDLDRPGRPTRRHGDFNPEILTRLERQGDMCPVRNEQQFLIAEGCAIAGFPGEQRECLPALR